jgi:hypothetical protein
VITLNLALGPRVKRTTVNVVDVIGFQVVPQGARDEGRAVIRQQPWTRVDLELVDARFVERDLQCILDIGGRRPLPDSTERPVPE